MADLDWLKKLEIGKGKYAFANKGFLSTRNAPVAGYIIHYTQGATSLNGNLSYANKARVGADLYIAQVERSASR